MSVLSDTVSPEVSSDLIVGAFLTLFGAVLMSEAAKLAGITVLGVAASSGAIVLAGAAVVTVGVSIAIAGGVVGLLQPKIDAIILKMKNFIGPTPAGAATLGDYVSVGSTAATVTEVPSIEDADQQRSTFPSSTQTPPSGDGTLTGTAVSQGSEPQQMQGSIAVNGEFSVGNGDGSFTIDGSVQADDTVSGTFMDGSESGTIILGFFQQLGFCSVTQQSGGQGTFSFSHFVGFGSGTVSFEYDAYSIMDAFTVSTSGGVKFTTGGLVSGSGSVQIPINNEQVVSINVSAPKDGTAWVYTLGCLGVMVS